jgi:hypothetical protein
MHGICGEKGPQGSQDVVTKPSILGLNKSISPGEENWTVVNNKMC